MQTDLKIIEELKNLDLNSKAVADKLGLPLVEVNDAFLTLNLKELSEERKKRVGAQNKFVTQKQEGNHHLFFKFGRDIASNLPSTEYQLHKRTESEMNRELELTLKKREMTPEERIAHGIEMTKKIIQPPCPWPVVGKTGEEAEYSEEYLRKRDNDEIVTPKTSHEDKKNLIIDALKNGEKTTYEIEQYLWQYNAHLKQGAWHTAREVLVAEGVIKSQKRKGDGKNGNYLQRYYRLATQEPEEADERRSDSINPEELIRKRNELFDSINETMKDIHAIDRVLSMFL